MEQITINTGLERFVLLDKIAQVTPKYIKGSTHFSKEPIYIGMEALTQLGAMHVRYLVDFQKHAFLLKTKSFSHTSGLKTDDKCLSGIYQLSGKQVSKSSNAFSYDVRAEKNNTVCFKGEFIFGTVDYGNGDGFKRKAVETHYKKVFSCLQNGLKTD
jgi:hypothetical protein